jgi:DNA-binding transcriptional ArsR family regulator
MQTTFAALIEPNRRRILDLLRTEERTVGELATHLALSQPAVSKHLRVLREAELVSVRVDAQRRRYRLRPARLAELDAWLAPYRQLWEGRLDRLEDLLADDPGTARAEALRDDTDVTSRSERQTCDGQ